MPSEYEDPAHAERYLNVVAPKIVNREHGERMVLDLLPRDTKRVLDLGTGDGRLLGLILEEHPDVEAIGLDVSSTMIEHARARFGSRATFHLHDLNHPLPDLRSFDAVVSCFAIHHVSHERKRGVYREAFAALRPGGVFANLEHVASSTERLSRAFYEAIGHRYEDQDPSNQCSSVEAQLRWLEEIGFTDVDCFWKWREIAVLAGVRPG